MRAFSVSISAVVDDELEDDEPPPPPPPPPPAVLPLEDAEDVVEPDDDEAVLEDAFPDAVFVADAVLLPSEFDAVVVFADVEAVVPLVPGSGAAAEVVDCICMV